ARIDLGAQTYNLKGRLNGQPAAILACYQLPGTNAINASDGVRKLMAEAKQRFPADMDYAISLDQTLAVREGMREILKTVFEALALVVLVVFIFLQGWRATLIPLCAVPVSLVGTFMLFPLFGFSIITLSLSPALSALLLRPRKKTRGPLGWFYDRFNRVFGSATHGYVNWSRAAIRKTVLSFALLLVLAIGAGFFGKRLPSGFLPEEDQGYVYLALQLPDASSLERTDQVCHKIEDFLSKTPGVQYTTSVLGFSLLSFVQNTYSGFFFVTFKPWSERTKPEEQYPAIKARLNQYLGTLSEGIAFAFPPPAIPGVGTSGGFTFMLEDRAGKDVPFLAQNVKTFLEAAHKRPELGT